MTSITARNAAALVAKNGTTLPKTTPRTKTVAKGNKAVASSNEAPATKAPAGTPTPVACGCGCGETANLGRQYRPGHDARHAGQIGRDLASGKAGAQEALDKLAPKLQAKAQAFAANRAKEAARKAAAAKVRDDAKAALKDALAAI